MEVTGEWSLALSVGPSLPAAPEWPPRPAGVTRRPVRLTELVQPSTFDGARCAAELSLVEQMKAQLDAYQLAVVKQLADQRPDLWDLTPDDPGGKAEGWVPARTFAGVTEFFVDELAVVLGCSPTRAHTLADTALVLTEQLPTTWEALADGRIDVTRARAIAKALGWQAPEVDPDIVAAVETRALGWALDGETPGRLQERTAAALVELDAAAADRRRKRAEKLADTRIRNVRDGMAEFVLDLPVDVAVACRDAVDSYARTWKADGDTRPIGQLRTLVAADLILRPWDTSREPVTAHITVVAPLGSLGGPGAGDVEECGSVSGHPITAAHLRDLLHELDALCPGGLQAPAGGSVGVSLVDPATGALRATVTHAQLRRLARRGCTDHPDTACTCSLVDRPPRTDRYEPTPAQRRWVKARDGGCRHPGCRRPAACTDPDHVVPHGAGGNTDCTNLCCLCRRHHRIKTHARGWHFAMTPDGVLSVTTPSGITRTTRPPGTAPPVTAAVTAPAHDGDLPSF
ncbi:protein of unknown function [Modestobacter sp. DSM 44400]|uniref:HNH endonuclease signature motif containing protein n=1 Tax=Modestobacter sp. DSM 44400 TaxID=1550230 RepID=UPI00089C21FC|nr:HNH endonuclease signature motif containing protein [Modestobacter sp. DSM 44400]SDY33142.1 protein of unknown function [Modestobacter sp. DSM 44400]